MKQTIFFAFFSFLILSSKGQTFEWAHNGIGAIRSDQANSVVADSAGNVYVAGSFKSPTITFGSITLTNSSTGSDAFIVKYDSAGTVLWAKSIGGTTDEYGVSLSLNTSGELCIGGVFTSTIINFDTIARVPISSGNNGFLAKYTPLGNVIWASIFGRAEVTAIETDAAGAIYVTGFHNYDANFDSFILPEINSATPADKDIFIAKYTSAGTVVWVKNAGSLNDETSSDIEVDNTGDVYLVGDLYGSSAIFDTITLNTTAINSHFLVKYNSSGNVLWGKNTLGSANPSPTSLMGGVESDSFGNIIIAGTYDGDTLIFGTDTLLNSVPGTSSRHDIYLVKVDPSGNNILATSQSIATGSGIFVKKIALDPAGSIYVAGFTGTTFTNSIIKKYSSSFIELWSENAITPLTTPPHDNMAFGLCVDAYRHIYISGEFVGNTIYFGSTTLANSTSSSGSYYDFYIAKLTPGTLTVWPGDANHDYVSNNYDLLPIGVYYSELGPARSVISNSWVGYAASNWGGLMPDGSDIKHVDCNGDGIVNANDTLAINLNFSFAHPFAPLPDESRSSSPNLYFVSSSSIYNGGDTVDIEIWAGTASLPVNGIYGIGFNMGYDASLVDSGTESLTYPAGWLGISGVNAITFGRIEPPLNMVFGAITGTNHLNKNGFGKIANFRFKANSSISAPVNMDFSITCLANDSIGNPFLLIPQTYSILINPIGTDIQETNDNSNLGVYPNPYSDYTHINYNLLKKSIVNIELFDLAGKKLKVLLNEHQDRGEYRLKFSAKESGFVSGTYLIRATINGETIVKRIVEID